MAWTAGPAGAGPVPVQGFVREARYGSGVDSVKVSRAGSPAAAYTDSTGAFTLPPGSVGVSAVPARAEVVWLAGPRAIAWTGLRGPLSLAVADPRGRIEKRYAGNAPEGRFPLAGLPPGVHFARVRAMGREVGWHWFQGDGRNAGPAGSATGDRSFALGAAGGPLAKAAGGDTLLFEKRGFRSARSPAGGAMEVRLERLPIRTLIVDGMSNHDWKTTTRIARAIYAGAGYFQVDVSTAPGVADSSRWNAWRPRFADYELVVLNYNSGFASGSLRWPAAREAELEAFVKGGGGLYVLHSANNSFPGWKEYNRMIGTGWRGSDFGSALEIGAQGEILRIPPRLGPGTSHGARSDAVIRMLSPHPIHRGFPAAYLASGLEIYEYARGPAEGCQVLSYAFDGPASGGSLKNWPIEILIAYGKGQVYNATPGHVATGGTVPDAARDVSFQTTFIRASEWLARREALYPVPRPFNSETRIVYRDLALP